MREERPVDRVGEAVGGGDLRVGGDGGVNPQLDPQIVAEMEERVRVEMEAQRRIREALLALPSVQNVGPGDGDMGWLQEGLEVANCVVQ